MKQKQSFDFAPSGTVALLLITLLLFAFVGGAKADNVYSGFTADRGTQGISNENFDKLVDGDTSTKWCNSICPNFIEFHCDLPFVPTGYILTTGNDNASFTGSNPKDWIIKAKMNESDAWTTLVTVENDNVLQDVNSTPYEFAITGSTNAYRYFRFEVSSVQKDSTFQLSEFQFKGNPAVPTNIANAAINGINSSYFMTGKEIKPTPTVTAADGTLLTQGTDYTLAWSGDGKTFGDYTVTVTGMGGYTGSQAVAYTVGNTLTGFTADKGTKGPSGASLS